MDEIRFLPASKYVATRNRKYPVVFLSYGMPPDLRIISFLMLGCFWLQKSLAQEIMPQSAYDLGMYRSDRFSTNQPVFHLNPALIPFQEEAHLSGHLENRFIGFGITNANLFFSLPMRNGFGAGGVITRFGNEEYKATGIKWSLGKRLGRNWSIGINEGLYKLRILEEGRPWRGFTGVSVTYRAERKGLMILAEDIFTFGTEATDRFSLRPELAGFYMIQPETTMYGALGYREGTFYPVFGIKQILIEKIEIFGSFQLYPAQYGTGFSLPLIPELGLTTGLRYHPVLGWSTALGLQWIFQKKD